MRKGVYRGNIEEHVIKRAERMQYHVKKWIKKVISCKKVFLSCHEMWGTKEEEGKDARKLLMGKLMIRQ